MIILLILGMFAGLYVLRLAFTFAGQALPVYVALTAAFSLHRLGCNYPFAFFAGLTLGVFVLAMGRHVFVQTQEPKIRLAVGLLFSAPAAVAGYQVVHSLGRLMMTNVFGLAVMSLIGGTLVAQTTWRGLQN